MAVKGQSYCGCHHGIWKSDAYIRIRVSDTGNLARVYYTTADFYFYVDLHPRLASGHGGDKPLCSAHAFDRWRILCAHHRSSKLGPALNDRWVTQKTSVQFTPKVPALPAVLRIVDLLHGWRPDLIMPVLSPASLQCWNIPKPCLLAKKLVQLALSFATRYSYHHGWWRYENAQWCFSR